MRLKKQNRKQNQEEKYKRTFFSSQDSSMQFLVCAALLNRYIFKGSDKQWTAMNQMVLCVCRRVFVCIHV